MTFDPAEAETHYPDRLLRHAAFATDPDESRAAARDWMAATDMDSVVYAQHRMIARLVLRHDMALGDTPVEQRLRGVLRQLRMRQRVNQSLLAPALAALQPLAPDLRLIGAGAWQARALPLAEDGLDVIDLVIRGGRHAEAVAILTAAGWTIAPAQADRWAEAAILWLSRGPSGKLRLHRPRAFPGLDPVTIFGDATTAQWLGTTVTLPGPAQALAIALSQATAGHATADQWLYDLAQLRDLAPDRTADVIARLPGALTPHAATVLHWARTASGLHFA